MADLMAGLIDRGPSRLAEMMYARSVAVGFGQIRHHCLEHFGVDLRRRAVVKIYPAEHICILTRLLLLL